MALGYGYVQRDPEDQQLNWAQIGKDVSDRLEGEITKREEKKEQLDNLTSDLVKELNTSQFLTENSNFNKFVLDSSDTIKNQTLLANKLLKSGQLKPREFTLMMQNLVDGTDQTFGLFQDYKDEYEKKMAMMAKDLPVSQQGSNIMYGILENVEGFSNFQNHQLVLNPDSGVMSIGKVIDGKVSTNPNDLTSVEQLKNRIRTTINKFDLYGSADSYVESLGQTTEEIITIGNKYRATEIQRITGATGSTLFDLTKDQIDEGIEEGIIDESDVKALREFNKGIDTYVESELGIDGTFSAASLLADYFPGYTTTFDEAEAKNDSKKILLRSVGGRVIADLSEEQKDLAKDTLKTTIRNGLSKKTETKFQQTVKDPSADIKRQEEETEERENLVNEISYLESFYNGTPNQVNKSELYFNGVYPGLSITRTTDNKVILELEGEDAVTYDLEKFDSVGDFVESISSRLIGEDKINDVNKIIGSDSERYGSKNISTLDEDIAATAKKSTPDKLVELNKQLINKLKETDESNKLLISFSAADYQAPDMGGVGEDLEKTLAKNIKEAFPELELEVRVDKTFGSQNNEIIISSLQFPNMQERTFQTGLLTDSDARDEMKEFKDYILALSTKKNIDLNTSKKRKLNG